MKIYINAKQIKKRGTTVAASPFVLHSVPHTLRDLITMLVLDGVQAYHNRLDQKDRITVLPNDELEAMAQVGKIGFGIPFGNASVNPGDAVEATLQGYADGLFRVFINDREAESLDSPLDLQEGDELTILRLVMLTGGFFR